jgi:hypothetical protein
VNIDGVRDENVAEAGKTLTETRDEVVRPVLEHILHQDKVSQRQRVMENIELLKPNVASLIALPVHLNDHRDHVDTEIVDTRPIHKPR